MRMKPNILVSENESIIAQDLEMQLKEWGYGVSTIVRSKDKTVKYIEEKHPDLVIIGSDANDGLNKTNIAQKIHEKYKTSVIFLSAWLNDQIIKQCEALESFYCIPKPYDSDELKEQIQKALEVLS